MRINLKLILAIALLSGYAAGSQVSAIQGHDQFRIDHTEYQEHMNRLENQLILVKAELANKGAEEK
jgi:hypothetical protein